MPEIKTARAAYRIDSEEQVRNWVIELVESVEHARLAIDINPLMTAGEQRAAYEALLLRHGSATGVIMAAHRLGKITDTAHDDLATRVRATLRPTVARLAQLRGQS